MSFDALLKKYKTSVSFFLNHKWIGFGAVAASIGVLVWLMSTTPTGLVPNEDTGSLMGVVDMPPATSLEKTKSIMDQVDSIARTIPAIQTTTAITGYSFVGGQGNTYGSFIIKLKNWEDRDMKTENSTMIVQLLAQKCSQIKDGRVMFFQPPMITGYGTTNGFEIKLLDKTGGDLNNFFQIYQRFIAALNARPEIAMAYSTFNPSFPQYMVDIDVAKVKQAGLTQNAVSLCASGLLRRYVCVKLQQVWQTLPRHDAGRPGGSCFAGDSEAD